LNPLILLLFFKQVNNGSHFPTIFVPPRLEQS
jgi:hypothetical protein